MPIYQFRVLEDHHAPDVRWTHLSNVEAAKKYARLLIQEFRSKGQFDVRSKLEIRDDLGRPVATLPFEDR
jgi:hypothetical protein